MKAPPDAALFPLTLEFVQRQRRKALVRAAAAAALADEQVAIVNADLFRDAVRARDWRSGLCSNAGSLTFELDRFAVRSMAIGVGPCLLAFSSDCGSARPLRVTRRSSVASQCS